jgi:anti-sigma-K factor RskA
MNKPLDTELPGGWEAGAAEYALGLMPQAEIDEFETRLAAEADLQQDVAAWTEYFATFTDLIPEEVPPPQVQRRIESRIFGVVEKRPIWQQVLPYLVGAVGGVVIAWIVFASGLLDPSKPVLRADLTGPGSAATVTAIYNPETGVLVLDGLAGSMGEGRVPELWLTPDGGGAAISLALLRGAQTLVALPPALQRDLEGAQLMITDEPAGGAPDGAPSGDAFATGTLGDT